MYAAGIAERPFSLSFFCASIKSLHDLFLYLAIYLYSLKLKILNKNRQEPKSLNPGDVVIRKKVPPPW